MEKSAEPQQNGQFVRQQPERDDVYLPSPMFSVHELPTAEKVDSPSDFQTTFADVKNDQQYRHQLCTPNRRLAALIFNVIKFDHCLMIEERVGSKIDGSNLCSLLHDELNYDIDHHEDTTSEQFRQYTRSFSEKNRAERVDSAVIIVMSKGTEEGFLSFDGIMVPYEDILKEYHSEELSGKATVFLCETTNDAILLASVIAGDRTLRCTMPPQANVRITRVNIPPDWPLPHRKTGSPLVRHIYQVFRASSDNIDLEAIINLIQEATVMTDVGQAIPGAGLIHSTNE